MTSDLGDHLRTRESNYLEEKTIFFIRNTEVFRSNGSVRMAILFVISGNPLLWAV